MDPNSWVNDCTACMSVQGGALWSYLKSSNVYICPDDLLNYDRTYSLNGYLNGEYASPAHTLSEVRGPSSGVFCFIEKYDPMGLNENSFLTSVYPASNWVDNVAPWHQNVGMLSFCDGHAIVWNWADARTHSTLTPGVSQPTNPDLRQLQTWFGPNPTPPGVSQ
jgi:prepilin-type processing-associated H-X9-DG protein